MPASPSPKEPDPVTTDRHAAYWDSFDMAALRRDHPIGDEFTRLATQLSRDELRARQNTLFLRCVARAWTTPFYQRLWGDAGLAPGDIQSLDDLARLPAFDKSHLMDSLDRAPPFGDLANFTAPNRPPAILHTTSGTTGTPQVLLFGPKTREAQALLLGRIYCFQGMRPEDVVHSVYGHGMINGGHYVREAVTHWTSAIFLSAGTGIETRSQQQVELMARFSATVLVGFADYLKRLAEVAEAAGLRPGRDIPIRMISGHLGREDRAAISAAWGGAACFDWYGVGDTGAIAAEGPDHDGLYVMEDAHIVEICDLDTGRPTAPGSPGDLVVTCLYKDDLAPLIRFNTHDVTQARLGASSIGVNFSRIEGFLGRSDNMVKIRGINIFPHGIGPILDEDPAFAGEFICIAQRDQSGRDSLTIIAETHPDPGDAATRFAERLKRRTGIDMHIQLAARGETAAKTQLETRQKPIRLIDERFR
jgi:phenylacetate-CoA ligase